MYFKIGLSRLFNSIVFIMEKLQLCRETISSTVKLGVLACLVYKHMLVFSDYLWKGNLMVIYCERLGKSWFPYYKHKLILATLRYIWNKKSKSYSNVRYSPPKFFCECTFPLVIKRATLNRPISTRNEPNFFGRWRVL